MRVSEQGFKLCAFVGYINQITNTFQAVGTCFFLKRHQDQVTLDDGVLLFDFFAVTAKHVIEGLRGKGCSDVTIQVGRTEGDMTAGKTDAVNFSIPIDDWVFHQELTVDLAVGYCSISVGSKVAAYYDELNIQEWLAEWEISGGEEVNIYGLFSGHAGSAEFTPIVRIGNVAALYAKGVKTKYGPAVVHLIECHSIGGLSGSPVLLNKGRVFRKNQETLVWKGERPATALFAVVSGHFDILGGEFNVLENPRLSVGTEIANVNSGIMIATPLEYVVPIIEKMPSRPIKAPLNSKLTRRPKI